MALVRANQLSVFFFRSIFSRLRNYAFSDLFTFAMAENWRQLTATDAAAATQKFANRSIRFNAQQVVTYKTKFNSTHVNATAWKQLDLHGSCTDRTASISYCGGPIVAMEWLPLPDKHSMQMLAVCCKNDHKPSTMKPQHNSIQMWRIDGLSNKGNDVGGCPKLVYSIVYDNGPVMHMKFCPSGAFCGERLGLLALPTQNGDINILSLPNCNVDEAKQPAMVLAIRPTMVLQLNVNPIGVRIDRLVTKIAWAEVSGFLGG